MNERGMVHDASKWCYQGIWGVLTSYFKLPAEAPNLPSMEGEHVEYLHPSMEYLEYRKFFFWIGLVVMDVVFTAIWIVIGYWSPMIGLIITPLALAIIVLPDIVAYIAIHLRNDTTWYVLTDRSMRLRRGIWTIHETTITFENVQNIHLQQGPVQRWFGFANLVVQTAGGSSGHGEGGGMAGAHMGILEGLNNAPEIRERILAHCQKSQSTGLGDDHHGGHFDPAHAIPHFPIETLREIRDLTHILATSATAS